MIRRNQKNIASTVTTWTCSFGGKELEAHLVNVHKDELCQQMTNSDRGDISSWRHTAAGRLGHAKALRQTSPL